ncbi:sensor histidine kinase [Lacihabitans sp. CCS-44]|uniref:sensor histidine kinase n=1 Tax=Lacihabitans sp. CCS-44 TaxID=2487331 RepID=UPI0020CF5B35|nr:ATP-binding protein [Lacihabitans sp. CCS-44]
MNKNLESVLSLVEESKHLTDEEKKSITKSIIDADKELEITIFKLERTDKVKRTTAILLEETIEELEKKRKAVEEQKRELEIETALERVRSSTMAMQHSDELTDVASLLFNQISALGIKTWTAGFNVWSEDNNSYVDYLSFGEGFIEPNIVHTQKAEALRDVSNARKSGVEFHVLYVEGEKIKQLYLALGKLDEKQYEILLQDGVVPSQQYEHFVFGSKVSLMFITYDPVPEAHHIFKRFGIVFEQTYTRFLDLQKAEAQAREAKIEASLERIRSHSMALQKSADLEEVIKVVFAEWKKLGLDIFESNINIVDHDNKAMTIWSYGLGYTDSIKGTRFQFFDHPFLTQFIQDFRNQTQYSIIEMSGENNKDYLRKAFTETDHKYSPEEYKQALFAIDKVFISNAFIKFGSMDVISLEPLPEDKAEILIRFAKVFEQTYTRFLDLQKAEAQTREAQIEVAVERVRAKALAMHKSAEIMGVAVTMRMELETLNMPGFDAATITLIQDDGTIKLWDNTSAKQHEDGTWENTEFIFRLEDNNPDFYLNKIWSSNDRYIVVEQDEHDLKITTDWVRRHDKNLADVVVHYYKENGIKLAWHPAVALTYGRLNLDFYVHAPEPEVENILIKMAAAFDLAYKRFLDLQKAELQARESQIQLALERVRARTMAMQRSEELPEVAALLFQQVKALGVPQFHCGFNIFEINDKECIWYPGSADGDILPPCKIPLTEHPVFIAFNESRKRGDELFVYEKEGEYQAGHYRYMLSLPVLGEMLQNMLDAGIPFPTFQIDHLANFSHGNLLFITSEHFPEMHETFKRFAKVFEQTYTRFLDLQKAEAQALEAIKRASVDRVRAEIASMRTTADLERITPIIWSELTTLGVPFIRCGVFIMDEEQQQVQSFLSTPDGNALAAFTQPYNASGETAQIVISWHKREIYKQHWDEAQFAEFTNSLLQQGAVKRGEKYLIENRPTDLYLHFLPFMQGMLYVGNTELLSDDELQLMQNLADAFSTAYARYEDFNQLEAAKGQIEKTLVDLKQAQTQLIQSEKMASLGELTAGIAHEIQNPLNFVNNFSEVSTEMIDEMNEELAKGDLEEVKAISEDLKQNLIKINHHGNRASTIVKGMLEHSRTSSKEKQLTDINLLADEYLRLSYHGLRAKDKSFNADFLLLKDDNLPKIEVIPQDIGRVLLNLINNAFQAPVVPSGGAKRVVVRTKFIAEANSPLNRRGGGEVHISIKDNGSGIPKANLEKIFQPFFTTKPTGQGTGLGLSLAYDIVTKGHGGTIEVESEEGVGTEFIVKLPVTS